MPPGLRIDRRSGRLDLWCVLGSGRELCGARSGRQVNSLWRGVGKSASPHSVSNFTPLPPTPASHVGGAAAGENRPGFPCGPVAAHRFMHAGRSGAPIMRVYGESTPARFQFRDTQTAARTKPAGSKLAIRYPIAVRCPWPEAQVQPRNALASARRACDGPPFPKREHISERRRRRPCENMGHES